MTSLVSNLNSLWLAQKIGNWVTTDDWCVHTADATQLDRSRRRRRCVLGKRHYSVTMFAESP